ncbi:protein windpipe [Drosophila grimshawi]|uniref:GH20432 n=1 Tax=Drosophila grimshawi TaxID=7222 RepID=B4J9Q7_DROGR|nr:protein windpipe [Drosophila grimshawi]XP_032591238.1 protein windpipe [Drosophila grimshawi]XP_032591239.1 protein windpipe [Drosophila grimshawi]EDW01471.1 GH20432 [Drosophila grimshawi]
MERLNLAALLALLLCVCASASPAFYCPEDCSCVLSQHTHKPMLHAKCNSTKGLQLSEQPLHASIPIHSIDLSYLGLTRLEHALDMLPNLTSVNLSHNDLHEIGHLSKRIKKLNVKHNRLTSAKLLKLPQHLQVLNLQHNDITYLPIELTHLHHLQQLELGHNNINCSCGTLEVRNWLQERHVYMEKPVICTLPAEANGKPWLQLKQSEVCEKEKSGFYANDMTDENELMMGDQPVADSGEQDNEEEEELTNSFMVIGKNKTPEPASNPNNDVEGSGDLTEPNMEVKAADSNSAADESKIPVDDEDGSGSGDGILYIPQIASGPDSRDDFDESPDSAEHGKDIDNKYDNQPMEPPSTPSSVIFNNIGIFDTAENDGDAIKPVNEEIIVPAVHTLLDADAPSDVVTDGPLDLDKTSEDILTAKMGKKDDSNAIYYLLGVIALIVVGLILFVAIKRCKYNSNAAARDAEAQRQTELLDMDKKQLGKPLARNGQEHAPLIGEKGKVDDAQIINGAGKKPYDSKDNAGQQPLLNGNGAANGDGKEVPKIVEPLAGEPAPHEYYPITPRYPTPQSPRASKYAQHPQGDAGEQNNNNNNNNEPDGAYLPSSPKSGRYSPVYSPETGRVKIKLTETPKPKTPMLVTRSKSNAGDIITTPVQGAGSYLEPTHQVNGIAGH